MAERRELRRTFDMVAGRYHAARPRYPAALFNALEQATGLAAPAEVLEIGCATGIATEPLARRGHRITCVELSAPGDHVFPTPDALPDHAAEIEATGLFTPVTVQHFDWEVTYDADGYIALLDTFSGHITMQDRQRNRLDAEIRRRLRERPQGTLRRHWGAVLRRGPPADAGWPPQVSGGRPMPSAAR